MQRKQILVVEDDEGIREFLQIVLEMEGFAVLLASNGKEALEILSQGVNPCLIILDLMMPVMDGWQFNKERIKTEAWANIPVVVFTAFAERAKSMQVQEVLEKPISLVDLMAVVKKYC
jgi:two-component system chemotaxis response regulator CheY